MHGQQWNGQWIAVKRRYHGSVELEGRPRNRAVTRVFIYIDNWRADSDRPRYGRCGVCVLLLAIFCRDLLLSSSIDSAHLTPALPHPAYSCGGRPTMRTVRVGEKQAKDRGLRQVGLSIILKASMLCAWGLRCARKMRRSTAMCSVRRAREMYCEPEVM